MAANKMSMDLIQQMVNNYKNKQYQSIVTDKNNPMPFDAQNVWFDLQALKTFIATIEAEVAAHPGHPVGPLGIRFYYSAYPDNDTWNNPGNEDIASLDPQYEKLHTLIAVPTAVINGVNQDFDPSDVNTYDGQRPPSAKGIAITAENHGDLSPPKPPIGGWF